MRKVVKKLGGEFVAFISLLVIAAVGVSLVAIVDKDLPHTVTQYQTIFSKELPEEDKRMFTEITSRQDMDQFYEKYKDIFKFGPESNANSLYSQMISPQKYDESFFKENFIILLSFSGTMTDKRVVSVRPKNESIEITVMIDESGMTVSAAATSFLMFEFDREYLDQEIFCSVITIRNR